MRSGTSPTCRKIIKYLISNLELHLLPSGSSESSGDNGVIVLVFTPWSFCYLTLLITASFCKGVCEPAHRTLLIVNEIIPSKAKCYLSIYMGKVPGIQCLVTERLVWIIKIIMCRKLKCVNSALNSY